MTAALGDMRKARELLDRLIAVDPSVERLNLCGSLHKREAMIHAAAGSSEAELAALAEMRARYRAARELARSTASPDAFYPMINVLAADLASPAAGRPRIEAADLAAIRESLASRVAASPDFWSVVGETELRMYEAVAAGSLAEAREALWREFSEHYQRVSAPAHVGVGLRQRVADPPPLCPRAHRRGTEGGGHAARRAAWADALRLGSARGQTRV